MTTAGADKIETMCKCGTRFRVPSAAVGKKAKCPKCGVSFVIAAAPGRPDTPAASPPASPPARRAAATASSPESSLLDDLAQLEQNAPALAQAQASGPTECPGCHKPMPPGAQLCVACGYNLQTGKAHKAASLRKAKAGQAIRRGSRFLVGCILCGVAALIGAGVWVAVALIAEFEIGWIAWGIGLLCGIGMLVGHGEPSDRGGIVAAGISGLGIVLGKFCVFGFVVYAVTTGNTSDIELLRMNLIGSMIEEQLETEGVEDDAQWDARWEELQPEIIAQVTMMSDNQVRRRVAAYKEEALLEEAMATVHEDETNRKRHKLAMHESGLRADEEFLRYSDPRREERYRTAFRDVMKLGPAELDARLAEADAWNAGGKWADEHYVRVACIWASVDQEVAALASKNEEDDGWEPPDAEWHAIRKNAETKCWEATHEARVARLQEVEREQMGEFSRMRLAMHHAMQKGNEMGLPPFCQQRTELWEAEEERLKELDEAQLAALTAQLDGWEEGRWQDTKAVRDYLIYRYAREELDADAAESADTEDEADVLQPDDDKWQQAYGNAVAKVDAVPESELVALAQSLRESDISKRREAAQSMRKRQEQEETEAVQAQVQEAAASFMASFFESMFRPIDILFFLLALGSAYGVASRGLGEQ